MSNTIKHKITTLIIRIIDRYHRNIHKDLHKKLRHLLFLDEQNLYLDIFAFKVNFSKCGGYIVRFKMGYIYSSYRDHSIGVFVMSHSYCSVTGYIVLMKQLCAFHS